MSKKLATPVLRAADLPGSFRLIRLELAREREHPEGSRGHAYLVVAPLDASRRIDANVWKQYRDACRVTRIRPGEDNEIGHLVHRPGGSWALHYDVKGNDEDEAGYRFSDERFILGEYVSIRTDDALHTFRVTSVEHL